MERKLQVFKKSGKELFEEKLRSSSNKTSENSSINEKKKPLIIPVVNRTVSSSIARRPSNFSSPQVDTNISNTVTSSETKTSPFSAKKFSFDVGAMRRKKNTIEVPELIEVEIIDENPSVKFKKINETQVQYIPVSKVNVTGAVIPEAMAEPTYKALSVLNEEVGGDIDRWVSHQLNWTIEELGHYLTSEQVDAVALGIRASMEGRGLIIADQTGFGKGRIQASIARYAALNDKPVIFLTEKENLFSDFWRDISDIDSAYLFPNPYMMNNGSKILDVNHKDAPVAIPAWKKSESDAIINSKQLPEKSNFMFMTYSQLNRKNKKVDFFQSVAEGSHITSDESHNCVGDSTTSENFDSGLTKSLGATFSSATFARDVGNLSVYKNVFPWLSDIDDLETYSHSLKRSLAEESIRYATENGNIIRREHDLTEMNLIVKDNPNKIDYNTELADKLAPILSKMGKLSKRVDAILYSKNENNKQYVEHLQSSEDRKKEKEYWFTANFGTRLSALVNQFLIALKVDDTIEECVNALKKGMKPVVVIESTMEALMKELSKDPEENQPDLEIDDDNVDFLFKDEDGSEDNNDNTKPPPTYKEALRLMTDKLLKVSVRRNGEKEVVDLTDDSLVRAQQEIKKLVEDFPELSLSPIDDIRDGIEKISQELFEKKEISKIWVTDEISARGLRVQNGEYITMPKINRNIRVSNFVNGETQCLILTNAASTGLSIHDSEKFLDHGQRLMIELSPPRNVLSRIQMWGRVWRRGQMTTPLFSVISTGLLFEVYNLAANNRKLRELSASVTGSGKASVEVDVADPIDSVGNDIAYEILAENTNLADIMGISMNVDKIQADKELYYVGKLFRRMPMLTSNNVIKLTKAFYDAYNDRMKNISHVYKNQEMEGEWKIIKREILQPGDFGKNPLTSKDLYLTTIESEQDVSPMRSAYIMEKFKKFKEKSNLNSEYIKKIEELREQVLQDALPKKIKDVKTALRSKEENSVKSKDVQISRMLHFLNRTYPGAVVHFISEDGDLLKGIVTDIKFPNIQNAMIAREYEYVVAVPGEEKPRMISLANLIRENVNRIELMKDIEYIASSFDDIQGGKISVHRKVLDGNGLAAVKFAHNLQSGSKAYYYNMEGFKKNVILLPKSSENKIIMEPILTTNINLAVQLIQDGVKMITNVKNHIEGIQIHKTGSGDIQITVPFGKRIAKKYETPEFEKLCGGKFQKEDSSCEYMSGRSLIIKNGKLDKILSYIQNDTKSSLYFPASSRKIIVEDSLQSRKKNDTNEEFQLKI